MSFLMVSAIVVFSMMVVTIRSGRYQFSFQISFHCLIRIALSTGTQLHTSFCKRGLCSAADASADEHIHRLFRQKPCQRAVSGAIGSDHFTGYYLMIFHFIHFEKLCLPKMLKYISVVVSYCDFHFYILLK